MNIPIPGGPDIPDIPGGGFDERRAQQLRDEIFAVAGPTEVKIAEGISARLADVQAVCSRIQAQYLGQAGITLDSIRAICNRAAEKIQTGAMTKWSEVVAYMGSAGINLEDIANASYTRASNPNVPPLGQADASALRGPAGQAGVTPTPILNRPYVMPGGPSGPSQPIPTVAGDYSQLQTLPGGGIYRDPTGPHPAPPPRPTIDPGPGSGPPTVTPIPPTFPPPGPGGFPPPVPGVPPPIPPGRPPLQPNPGNGVPCNARPDPDSPTGFSNWEGTPCPVYSDGTCPPNSACSCEPGQHWHDWLIGCINPGLPSGSINPVFTPGTQFPPMPPACQCGCCDSCNDRHPCPDGYTYVPSDGSSSPTLVGGSGGDGPSSPTLRGGGGPDGGFSPTLKGGSGGDRPVLIARGPLQRVMLRTVDVCQPTFRGGLAQYFTQLPLPTGPAPMPEMQPWLDNSRTPAGFGVDKCCVKGCHLTPPTEGTLCVYKPMGWKLIVDSHGIIFTSPAMPPYGFNTELTCDAPDPNAPSIDPAAPGTGTLPPGKCVPKPPGDGGACPVPPQLDCGADAKNPKVPGIEQPFDPCDAIGKAVDKLKADNITIADALKIKSEKSDKLPDTVQVWLRAVFGVGQNNALGSIYNRLGEWLDKFVRDSAKDQSCDTASLIPVVVKRAILHFVQRWTDAVPEQPIRELDQVSNFLCQSKLPSGSEADRAWLHNEITDDEWECYHKAEGDFISPMKKVVRAARTQPTVKEWITLYRREQIDATELFKRLRGHGIIEPQEQQYIYSLSEQRPPISDLIRFMVRDVFDEQVVTDGQLDEDFDLKWTDIAQKLGKAIGVGDSLARQYWRAHWQYPSYTQGREMLYRLRPDKYPGEMAFDAEAFRKMLKVDDHAPGFVKRLIEIAYHPILATDAERMYQVRQIDETALAGVYMDHGYKPEDADAKVEYAKLQRQFYDLTRAGFPSLSELNRLYGQCLIDEGTLTDGIMRWVTSDEQAQEAIETAEIRRSITERKSLITTIQKQYRFGLIDDATATQQLAEGGIDPGCIAGLVRRFRGQRQRQPKQAAASTLCKWFAHGILSAEEMLQALIRQGWLEDDALRIVRECEYEQAERQRKAQEAAAAKASRLAEKEAKAAAKAAKASQRQRKSGG